MDFNATSGTAGQLFDQQMAELGFGLETTRIIRSLAQGLTTTAANIESATAGQNLQAAQSRAANVSGLIGSTLGAFGQGGAFGAPLPTPTG